MVGKRTGVQVPNSPKNPSCAFIPPPPCISYALVQATVGVGTVIIVYVILITCEM